MNNYKEILYRSFRNSIGPNVTIDIYFHYYNLEIFETLISENIGRYSHYVVMPHFNSDVTALLKKIPLEKLLIIDKNVANLQGDYACVYQNFEEDIYEALQTGNVLLKKYKKFNLILHDGFQFIPEGIILGYKKFCKNFGFDGKLIEHLPKGVIRKGEAYLAISDMDMIGVIKSAQEKDWILGENIGLISYDDTPIKEVLAGGVTVLSTDFESMGRLAAELILSKKKAQIRNSFSLIKRRSL